jgi:hypothetical protein
MPFSNLEVSTTPQGRLVSTTSWLSLDVDDESMVVAEISDSNGIGDAR